jgi:hypothetical protein
MTLEDWLQTLRSTETYKSGVYNETEYGIKRRLPTFRRALPPVPRADADRHIIVMEVVGDAPVFVAGLTTDRPSIHVSAQDADRMLFIFVEMRRRALDVSAAAGTYRLADGDDVDCRLALEWRVEDAESFWKGSGDPVATLRARVIGTAREYLAGLTSERLLDDPSHVERGLADRIFDRAITIIRNGLETHVLQHASVPGVKIEGVSVVIESSELLTEHLRRLRDRFYGPGGLIDRRKIDRLLELDQTYAPYRLRDVARFLDMRLLENFYSKPWQEAMDELAAAFEAKKTEFRPKDRLTTIEEALDRAKKAGLDHDDITLLKEKFAEALLESLDRPDTRSAVSDQAFLTAVLGPPQPTAQIGAAEGQGDPH